MSAALRPALSISPIPELRDAFKRKLDQVITIAVEARLADKPDRQLLRDLRTEQRVWLTVLADLDHYEGRR